jgi:zinc protease
MRPLAIALVVAAAVLGCAGQGGSKVAMEQAKGGLKLTLLPSPQAQLVTIRVIVRSGAAADPAGKEGLASLTAAMIGSGGTASLAYEELLQKLFPMAASIDFHADKEVTVFVGQVHHERLEAFYPIFRDLFLAPRFDPADFRRNRDDLVNAIEKNLRGNDDENLGKAALELAMYEGHPYGALDDGTVQGLKSLALEDARAFFARHYTRDNVHLGVAGGLPPAFLDRILQDFLKLPGGEPEPVALSAPRRPRGIEVVFVEKECRAPAISIGCPIGVTRAHDDFYPLMVANSYLGEHRTFNGVLMNNMRGKRGLNYGDYSYIESFIQEGGSTFPVPNIPRRQQFFSIWIRPVRPENTLFALRQAVRELDRLVSQGLSQQDFETTREFLMNYSRLWAQTQSRRLGYLLDSKWYLGQQGDFLAEVQGRLPGLTREQVNAAARKHLQAKDLVVAIVCKDAAAMREKLLSGAPTPIVYDTEGTPPEILAEDKEIEAYPLPLNRERARIVPAAGLFEKR